MFKILSIFAKILQVDDEKLLRDVVVKRTDALVNPAVTMKFILTVSISKNV